MQKYITVKILALKSTLRAAFVKIACAVIAASLTFAMPAAPLADDAAAHAPHALAPESELPGLNADAEMMMAVALLYNDLYEASPNDHVLANAFRHRLGTRLRNPAIKLHAVHAHNGVLYAAFDASGQRTYLCVYYHGLQPDAVVMPDYKGLKITFPTEMLPGLKRPVALELLTPKDFAMLEQKLSQPIVAEELQDEGEIQNVLAMLRFEGVPDEIVLSHGVQLKGDPRNFMDRTKVFAVRDKRKGDVLAAALFDLNLSRAALERTAKARLAYPEPFSWLVALRVRPEIAEKAEFALQLLAEGESRMRALNQATCISLETEPMFRRILPAQGYAQQQAERGVIFAKVLIPGVIPGSDVNPALLETADPFEILDLIHHSTAIRELLRPAPGALDGLLKKMKKKNKKGWAAEQLMQAVPGIEKNFPNLRGGPAGRVKDGASAPWKLSRSDEEALTYALAQSKAFEVVLRGQTAEIATADLEALKLYFTVFLFRVLPETARKTLLNHWVSRGRISAGQRDAMDAAHALPPHAALAALAAAVPGAGAEGTENLYSYWIKGLGLRALSTDILQAMSQELQAIVREDKIALTLEGQRIPFATFFHVPGENHWRLREYLRDTEPLKRESLLSPESAEAGKRDIQTLLDISENRRQAIRASYADDYNNALEAREILRHVYEALPKKDATVMELGALSGAFPKELARQYEARGDGRGVRLIAVDKDAAALQWGKALRQEEGMSGRIEFETADAARLDFLKDNETVQAIVLKRFMNHLHGQSDARKTAAILIEMDRVLALGGQVHVVDDGNTPWWTYLFFDAMGYGLTAKRVIKGVMGHGDYTLLSFVKVLPHAAALEKREALAALDPVPLVRPSSPAPAVLAQEKLLAAKDLAKIPEPASMLYSHHWPLDIRMEIETYLLDRRSGFGLTADQIQRLVHVTGFAQFDAGLDLVIFNADDRVLAAAARAIELALEHKRQVPPSKVRAAVAAHERLHQWMNQKEHQGVVGAVRRELEKTLERYLTQGAYPFPFKMPNDYLFDEYAMTQARLQQHCEYFDHYNGSTKSLTQSIAEQIITYYQEKYFFGNPVRLLPPWSEGKRRKDIILDRRDMPAALEYAIERGTQDVRDEIMELLYDSGMREEVLKNIGVESKAVLKSQDPARALLRRWDGHTLIPIGKQLNALGNRVTKDALLLEHFSRIGTSKPQIEKETVRQTWRVDNLEKMLIEQAGLLHRYEGEDFEDFLRGLLHYAGKNRYLLRAIVHEAREGPRWPEIIESLRGYLVEKNGDSIRCSAAEALAELRDSESVPLMLEILGRKSPVSAKPMESHTLRIAVIKSLGVMQAERAMQQLEHALGDADAEIRLQAVLALKYLGNPGALPSLQSLAGNGREPDLRVRQALGGALLSLEAAGRRQELAQAALFAGSSL